MITIRDTTYPWDRFCHQIEAFLAADRVEMMVNGLPISGYRSPDNPALWIRDHSDIVRGGRFFEADVCSAPTCFAEAQAANGRIYDYVITAPESWSSARENWEKWVRVPVEADVEYRFVKAGYLAWQATGDTAWLTTMLPSFEKALQYTLTHPLRWDAGTRLVKRPYTIDTWDFDYTAGRHDWLNFQITPDTFWGIMHGDNSGMYEAALLLSKMYHAVGAPEHAVRWHDTATGIRERANALLFNGRFYTHFYKLYKGGIPGVDEAEQLSLSNPMAINRGMATKPIAEAILSEYQRRQRESAAFAAWFSIDPPFPAGVFGEDKLVPGSYINGGVMPLVGGELACAALTHGQEAYGVAILKQYAEMIAAMGETYLWYFPDGTPSSVDTSTSPEAMPTDGWGSSAMLYAFVEGLCGIQDLHHSFEHVRCAPRWAAAAEDRASVHLSYAASGAAFGYRYAYEKEHAMIRLYMEAQASEVTIDLLLPEGVTPKRVTWDGQAIPFTESVGEGRRYVVISGTVKGHALVAIEG